MILTCPTVHPRVCGEHCLSMTTSRAGCGSSPRLRGTLRLNLHCAIVVRFIPASAGNTNTALAHWHCVAVHPRVCGEHFEHGYNLAKDYGSSPRLRGTLQRLQPGDAGRRFIPASAGNTRGRTLPATRSTVHPRVCGEHFSPVTSPRTSGGSSPRLRGTPISPRHHTCPQRFIPASAGNT